MRKQTPLKLEIDRLLEEIRDEEESVPLSPWTVTFEDIMTWDKEDSDWDKGKRDYGLIELCDADTPQKLNESSLGHVYWRYIESKTKCFTIVNNYSKVLIKHNKQKVKYLIDEIDINVCFHLWGHSQEDGPDNNKIHTVERYYFLVGFTLNVIRDLLAKYGPYSILYCGPETDGNVTNYKNLGTIDDIGTFCPNKIAQLYSKNLGSPIVFETRIPGWIAGSGALHHGIKEVAGIRKSRKWISKAVRNFSF